MLLVERVKRVRRAAAYVFRNHPEIFRQFTTAYERRRRAVQRQAKAEAEERKWGRTGRARRRSLVRGRSRGPTEGAAGVEASQSHSAVVICLL
jgi:hypothetical protein